MCVTLHSGHRRCSQPAVSNDCIAAGSMLSTRMQLRMSRTGAPRRTRPMAVAQPRGDLQGLWREVRQSCCARLRAAPDDGIESGVRHAGSRPKRCGEPERTMAKASTPHRDGPAQAGKSNGQQAGPHGLEHASGTPRTSATPHSRENDGLKSILAEISLRLAADGGAQGKLRRGALRRGPRSSSRHLGADDSAIPARGGQRRKRSLGGVSDEMIASGRNDG